MRELTDGQKLRITRLGRRMTLEDVAKLTVLSPSHISYIEHGRRSMPDDIPALIDLDSGIKWYQDIDIILRNFLGKQDYEMIMGKLDSILGIKE